MTDNEIIKALECCILSECENCPHDEETACKENLNQEILDLINRQKAEIQKAKAELKETTEKFNCQQYVYADLSDIIRDKNAEIERLQADYSSMQSTLAKMSMGVEQTKAEAIKEYTEKLKGKAYLENGVTGFQEMVVDVRDIDETYDEMVGEG